MTHLTGDPRVQNWVPRRGHFFQSYGGRDCTVELVSMSSFEKYIHFPIIDIPPCTV
jgi:hypothetical protein